MNYLYNAMCCNEEKIWCIDAKGVLYEIDKRNDVIKLVHWIEELEDDVRLKFSVMCYADGNLILAPCCGQSFWLYNVQTGCAERLTEAENETYANFYDFGNQIFFIDTSVSKIVIYNKNNCNLQKETINSRIVSKIDTRVTRGGYTLKKGEDTVYQSIFGTNKIYQICLKNLSVREKSFRLDLRVALAHKIEDVLVYVLTNGEIWQEKDEEIVQLKMPDGAKMSADPYAPYHYWTRAGGGLVLLPCDMNMVLLYKDSEIRNIYTSSNRTNAMGQMGIYPCCSTGYSSFVGFPRYEDVLYEFDLTKQAVEKHILRVDVSNGEAAKCIALKTKKLQEIYEGDFDITIKELVDII